MNQEKRPRSPSELLKRGYSEVELQLIYSLGRFNLEVGSFGEAEKIFKGLSEVAPDFLPGWLGLSVVSFFIGRNNEARVAAHQALRLAPNRPEAQLISASILMSLGDFNAAGANIGEVKDLIEAGAVVKPEIITFYKLQLARFECRQ